MASRRPLAIYSAKRRQRSISNPHTRLVEPSSPLKQLGGQDADLSVAEMSRRMMKRSRSGLQRLGSASAGASPNDPKDDADETTDDARPVKKSRVVVELEKMKPARVPLQTIVEPGSNLPVGEGMTVDMDLTSVVQLKTPTSREDTTTTSIPGATHIPARDKDKDMLDFLSPLPSSHSAKRVLAHRTSSTQLKENKENKIRALSGITRSVSASNTDNNGLGLVSPAPPLSLASPFNSRPGSPSRKRLASRRSSKKGLGKTLNRTRSVGTDLRRKATMRSFSRAVSPAPSDTQGNTLNRHPSHPTSLASRRDNQEWFVSPRLKQPGLITSPTERSQTPAAQVPFVRETSFFNASPQACSTPVPPVRTARLDVPPMPCFPTDLDATPRFPLALLNDVLPLPLNDNEDFLALDGPTPRARPVRSSTALDLLLNSKDSLFSDAYIRDTRPASEGLAKLLEPAANAENTRRRMTVHLPQDSIFSSAMDLSVSVTAKQPSASVQKEARSPSAAAATTLGTSSDPELPVPVPSSSPAAPVSPASSEGDELRDMFSIMGLDEDEHWNMTSGLLSSDDCSTFFDAASGHAKVKKNRDTKRALTETGNRTPPASSISRVPPKRSIASPIATRARLRRTTRPTIKMKIDAEPVNVTSDEDDELLLTSKGWEWDPIAKQIVPSV